ncbi:MAG: Phosphorylated carbohydrates phosphatase [Candidatus Heimdallarchaeota archaeon LC_2]|nr:MAG: Phosphorylated carbohydrates phosphatase [Candidatus Heimdallarchaeota archaeon LC_2]
MLFDLDGTLIHSLDLHIEAFQEILNQMGKSVSRYDLEPLMGLTPQDIIQKFTPELSHQQIWQAALEKEDHLSTIIKEIHVFPHVVELLTQLALFNVKKVVISSTHQRLVILLLEAAGIMDLIDEVVSGDEVKNGKPNPDPFLLGMNKAKASTSTTIAIGDSLHDQNSAKAAFIPFLSLLTGKTDKEAFDQNEAKMIIANLASITIR